MQRLALFDFDGTISDRDSFLLFVRYASGRRFYAGCMQMAPQIAWFLLKRYPNYRLKQDFVRYHFTDWPEARLDDLADAFCREKLPGIIRAKAAERMDWHRSRGDTLAIVSACLEDILAPWCRQHCIELLGTRLQRREGRVTGELEGANCWGEEKVRRIRERFRLDDYAEIFAYGDSAGDNAMLAIADQPHFKPFV